MDQINRLDSNDQVDVFNVYEEDVPFIDQDVLSAWGGALRSGTNFEDLTVDQQEKVGRMGQILSQFKEADDYVIVSPLWNFSITPKLKAYIDNIMIAGETFRYTENGPVGMLSGKKATIIQASGGVYSSGPAAAMEHGSNYLKTVLSFMGVDDISTIFAEGIAIPDKSEIEKLDAAYRQVDDLLDFDLV